MQPCDSLLLFVYGTLKRGEKNHNVMEDAIYLGDIQTSPDYLLVDLGPYPGMIEKPLAGSMVQGELFEIPSSLLNKLDKIEGSPYLFNLEPISLADGSKAFAYLFKQSILEARMLSDGVWKS